MDVSCFILPRTGASSRNFTFWSFYPHVHYLLHRKKWTITLRSGFSCAVPIPNYYEYVICRRNVRKRKLQAVYVLPYVILSFIPQVMTPTFLVFAATFNSLRPNKAVNKCMHSPKSKQSGYATKQPAAELLT